MIGDVIRKGVALLVGMAVVIAAGTWLVVHALGLNDAPDSSSPVQPVQPISPLPTTALAVPDASPTPADQDTGLPDDGETGAPADEDTTAPPDQAGNRQLRLSATPTEVSPMGRINLTGTYGSKDNVSLEVQRWENGTWGDFPTSATVSVGTFATYVQTSQPGVNRFRVYDPSADVASNVVQITVR